MKLYMVTTWPDDSMDCITTNYLFDTPVNQYKIKCNECKFPDIDTPPEPYFIRKKYVYSNWEMYHADLGNIFLSHRIKEIFLLLFPQQIEFRPVFCEKTTIKTRWWLGIIKNKVKTAEIKEGIPGCRVCNEPLHWHPGSQSKYREHEIESGFDMVKSINWHSVDEKDWKKSWINRDTLFSKRLFELLKALKIKTIHQYSKTKPEKITEVERIWVNTKLAEIPEALKIPQHTIPCEDEREKRRILGKVTEMVVVGTTKRENKLIKPKYENGILDLLKMIAKPVQLPNDSGFFIACFDEWRNNSEYKMKFIDFAFDNYGNHYSIDSNNKNYPIYFYDHEQSAFEEIYGSIYEFCDSMF